MLDVTKVLFNGEKLVVDYNNDKGSFRMSVDASGDNEPSPDLYKAVGAMLDIFAYRMDLESKRDSLVVTGLEAGMDQKGEFFRIHGNLMAHSLEHKLTTGKLREMLYKPGENDGQEEFFDVESSEEKEQDVVNDYPSLLTSAEHDILMYCIEEAQEFVNGKRLQKSFDFDGDGEDAS